MTHDPRTTEERAADELLARMGDVEHAARVATQHPDSDEPLSAYEEEIVGAGQHYTGQPGIATRAADDRPEDVPYLRQLRPGYSAERNAAEDGARQIEREAAPLSPQEIDDAEVADGLGMPLSPAERAAVEERRSERQLADDAHAVKSSRERLSAAGDQLNAIGAQLDHMSSVVGRFETGGRR